MAFVVRVWPMCDPNMLRGMTGEIAPLTEAVDAGAGSSTTNLEFLSRIRGASLKRAQMFGRATGKLERVRKQRSCRLCMGSAV